MAAVPPRTERRRAASRLARSDRSTDASTAAPGCSSGCRCWSPPSVSRGRRRCPPRAFLPAFDGAATEQPRAGPRRATRTASPARRAALGAAGWFREPARAVRACRFGRNASAPSSPARARSSCRTSSPRSVGRSPRDDRRDGAPRRRRDAARARTTTRRAPRCSIQLARAYGAPAGCPSGRLRPNHTIVFVSTDGGAFGGARRGRFAAHSPLATTSPGSSTSTRSAAAGASRLEITGDTAARSPRRDLPADDRAQRMLDADGPCGRHRPSALAQLIDLGFPFTLYEQAPFLAHGIAGAHADDGGRQPSRSRHRHAETGCDADRLGQVGRAAQDALGTLDEGARVRAGNVELRLPRLAAHPRLGDRARPDRVLCCRSLATRSTCSRAAGGGTSRSRRRSALPQPARLLGLGRRALRALRARSARGPAARRGRSRRRARSRTTGPRRACSRSACSRCLGWLVARERLVPRRAITPEEELAGHTAALLCLGALVAARRRDEPLRARLPPAVAPRLALASAAARARRSARLGVLAAGLPGPALLLGSLRRALRARLGRALVPRGAAARSATYRFVVVPLARRLARGRGAARRARDAPLRAVPARRRAPAARSDAQSGADDRPRSARRRRRASAHRPEGVGGLDATSVVRIAGTLLAVAGALDARSGRSSSGSGRTRSPRSTRSGSSTSSPRSTTSGVDASRAADRDQRDAGGTSARASRAKPTRYRTSSTRGEAIGRIRVPRMGLNMILVNGTDHDTLKKGPGRDAAHVHAGREPARSTSPGHRTTYLAPFSHIDALRSGDRVTLEVPYGTFVYRVTRHRIVPSTDLSVLRSPRHEVVELQACHPRFFASHRYIAYATAASSRAARREARTSSHRAAQARAASSAPVAPAASSPSPRGREDERVGRRGAHDHVRLLAA